MAHIGFYTERYRSLKTRGDSPPGINTYGYGIVEGEGVKKALAEEGTSIPLSAEREGWLS